MRGVRPFLTVAAIVSAAVAGPAGPVSAGGPITLHYPACATDPSDPNLQDCVDAAIDGSTIVIESDDAADGGAFIQKSLSIVSEAGHRHTVGTLVFSDNLAPTFGFTGAVRGITVRDSLGINLLTVSGDSMLIDDVIVAGRSTTPLSGADIEVSRPSAVTIRNSTFRRHGGPKGPALFYGADMASGDVATLDIQGSYLSLHGFATGGAGLELALKGAGTVRAAIDNTAIWDVGQCRCSVGSGIVILPSGQVHASVDIVGVTVERSGGGGITARNHLTGAGHLALRIFDTITSHTRLAAIGVDAGGSGSVSYQGGWNDRFGTGAVAIGALPAGPNNRTADPRYLDAAAGNLALRSDSTLIDKGLVCTPAGVVGLDAAGRWRVKGASSDIGAYEHGAPVATGVVRLGTDAPQSLVGTGGADILCGYGGTDLLSGLGGPDWIDGGAAADILTGGDGGDRLLGGPGRDRLCGIDGVPGNDRVDGGPGRDAGSGDAGDTLVSVEDTDLCAP